MHTRVARVVKDINASVCKNFLGFAGHLEFFAGPLIQFNNLKIGFGQFESNKQICYIASDF